MKKEKLIIYLKKEIELDKLTMIKFENAYRQYITAKKTLKMNKKELKILEQK